MARTLRDLPAIETLLNAEALLPLIEQHGNETVKRTLRELQAAWRRDRKVPEWGDDPEAYAQRVEEQILVGARRAVDEFSAGSGQPLDVDDRCPVRPGHEGSA